MPAALLLAATALVVLLLGARSRAAQLQGSGAYVGDLPIDEAIDAPAAEPVASGFAGSVFAAGQAVLDTVGQAVTRLFELPARAAPYAEAIREAEVKNSLPAGLLGRLLYEESRFRPEIIDGTVKSSAGAIGIAQIVPRWHPGVDPRDPFASIAYAGVYLRRLFDRFGDWHQALAAYNWGQGNLATKDLHDGVFGDDLPKETRGYVDRIARDVGLA